MLGIIHDCLLFFFRELQTPCKFQWYRSLTCCKREKTHTHTHTDTSIPEKSSCRRSSRPPFFRGSFMNHLSLFRLRVYKIIGRKWSCLKWWQRTSSIILNLACLKIQWSGFAISLFVRVFLTSPLKGSLRMMTSWPNSKVFFVGEACRFNGQTFPGFPGFMIIWPDRYICWKSTLPFFKGWEIRGQLS